jgi:Mechanosensitive ion channel MscS, C-terminal
MRCKTSAMAGGITTVPLLLLCVVPGTVAAQPSAGSQQTPASPPGTVIALVETVARAHPQVLPDPPPQAFFTGYGDSAINFTIECPTGSGRMMNLFGVAGEIADRLARIFLRDGSGRRPVYGGTQKFQQDPHWRDHLLFYEYFHGDNGAGLGASHQTGWTGVVAKLIQLFGVLNPKQLLEGGIKGGFAAQAGQTGGVAGRRER